jgi:ribosome maturation factor RimP
MNDKLIIEEKIMVLAQALADRRGFEIIEIKFAGRGRRSLLRITIDKTTEDLPRSGISLDECTKFSREIEALIEEAELINGPYNLEVSSPGLDRPLTAISDFTRNKGKDVRIFTNEKLFDRDIFIGKIIDVSENIVKLGIDDNELEIPFEKILKARLEIKI